MVRAAILASVFAVPAVTAGCASARRQAEDEQVDCVYEAQRDWVLTDAERTEIVKGCHEVWLMRMYRMGFRPGDIQEEDR